VAFVPFARSRRSFFGAFYSLCGFGSFGASGCFGWSDGFGFLVALTGLADLGLVAIVSLRG
jgi:hypothetical protein